MVALLAQPRDPAKSYWSEIGYLAEHTRADGLTILSREGGPVPKVPSPAAGATPGATTGTTNELPVPPGPEMRTFKKDEAAAAFLKREGHSLDCGCLVLEKRRSGVLVRMGLFLPPYSDLLQPLPCPTLLSAGTHPYRRILLPVTESLGTHLASELAIDLCRQLDLPLSIITVSPPAFVVGQEAIDEQKNALSTVAAAAALYHLKVEQIRKEGNPVGEIAALSGPGDLLVIASKAGRRSSFFNPDTSRLLIDRVPCSVMVLSYTERAHGNP
jgi:nucleotide-binding universal stress UspA family protein